MAYSSILGADLAPVQPSGRDAELLGPSDSSDTGSDAVGTYEIHGDSDAAGTGERSSATPGDEREGADILPDHVVRMGAGDQDAGDEDAVEDEALASGEGFPAGDIDAREFTDLDPSDPDLDLDATDDDQAQR